MSTYAPFYPISGFLPQPYISTLTHSTGFGPSISASSVSTGRYSTLGKKTRIPTIVVEDTSLDMTLDDTINLSSSLLKTPAKQLGVRNSLSGSPDVSWLDEKTLTNTPSTALSKEKLLSSTPKRDLPGRKSSTPTFVLPDENVPSEIPVKNGRLGGTVSAIPSSNEECTALQEIPCADATVPSTSTPSRRVPKLRRSNGKDDLRTLYHRAAFPRVSPPSDVHDLSFEEQLTLAILAEMDRNPNRFLAHQREPVSKARLDSGRSASILSTLGNLLQTVKSPIARVW